MLCPGLPQLPSVRMDIDHVFAPTQSFLAVLSVSRSLSLALSYFFPLSLLLSVSLARSLSPSLTFSLSLLPSVSLALPLHR